MCGRYALALRPSQVRRMLENDDMPVEDMPDDEGADAPRQSHNFAPGYHGIVYRADTPDWGAGNRHSATVEGNEDLNESGNGILSEVTPSSVRYKLQSMKWGLVPFWTKRNPDYASMLRTINCRDDSLATSGGMWTTMKARKRCIVIAQGFFEWLKTSSKEKLPHFVKRKDGRLMCFAGLWDCVQYEDSPEKTYTYTIITTDSNKQLKFLHDRMPVILEPGSEDLKTWLDPSRTEWSRELQRLLRPFEGDLDVFPVSKDVGKVGNDSPSFLIPINSKQNKSNIANFFKNNSKHDVENEGKDSCQANTRPCNLPEQSDVSEKPSQDTTADQSPGKRMLEHPASDGPLEKKQRNSANTIRPSQISSTHNTPKAPVSAKAAGSQKITKFFGHKT